LELALRSELASGSALESASGLGLGSALLLVSESATDI
jgi:hypothetical protein